MAKNAPVTVDANGNEIDELEAEMNQPRATTHELDREYTTFAEVMGLELRRVKYDPGLRRFVPADKSDPDSQPEAYIKLVPMREGALADERNMLNSSLDWREVVMPSLQVLGITFGSLRDKFVQYVMKPTGEIYLDKKSFPDASADDLKGWNKEAQRLWKASITSAAANGSTKLSKINEIFERLIIDKHPDWIGAAKIKKAPSIQAVFATRDECQAAADAFYASRRSSNGDNGHEAAPQAAPTAAAPKTAAGNDQMRAFALKAIEFKWQAVGGKLSEYDPAKYTQFTQLFNSDSSVNQYVQLDDPEVIAITGNPLA